MSVICLIRLLEIAVERAHTVHGERICGPFADEAGYAAAGLCSIVRRAIEELWTILAAAAAAWL